MAVPVLGGVLEVISKGIEYLTLLSSTSHVRKLRRAVDYGETFINNFYELVNEEDPKKKIQLRNRLDYCKKKFFKYNQG